MVGCFLGILVRKHLLVLLKTDFGRFFQGELGVLAEDTFSVNGRAQLLDLLHDRGYVFPVDLLAPQQGQNERFVSRVNPFTLQVSHLGLKVHELLVSWLLLESGRDVFDVHGLTEYMIERQDLLLQVVLFAHNQSGRPAGIDADCLAAVCGLGIVAV